MKTLGERIKALRAHLNMTQSEFCGLCGMLTTSLSRIENDEVTPRSATLKQIIGNTGVDPKWLLEGTGEISIVSPPANTNSGTGDIYRDALYSELRSQASKWEQKYNELWITFNKVIDRGTLGKLRAIGSAGGKKPLSMARN